MERVRIIFLALAVICCLPARAGNLTPRPEADFTVFEENGKMGLKDKEGHVLIPAHYEAIGWSHGTLSVVDKVVGYQSNGLWGLIHTSNKVITPPEFAGIRPGEGSYLIGRQRSALSHRDLFGVISTSGKIVIPFVYDEVKLSNMRAVVMTRSAGKYLFGLVDLSHRVLIPIEYRNIHPLGSLRYAVENTDGKSAIFSEEGAQITSFDIDSISPFSRDFAIVYKNQKQGVIDRSGKTVVQPEFGEVDIGANSIRARQADEWFFLSGENQVIRQCRADALTALPSGYAITSAGKIAMTDEELKPLHDGLFSSLGEFDNGVAVFRRGMRAGVIRQDGAVIVPASYHQLAIDHGMFRACADIGYKNRWILLDAKGNRISEKHYDYIAPYNGTYFPVRNRGFWGVVDATGRELITCVHDSLVQNVGKNIAVRFKGEYGVIDLHENWIVTPRANPLRILNDSVYLELAGKTTFVKSFPDGIIYFSENPLEYRQGVMREQLVSGASWTVDMNGIIIERSEVPSDAEIIFQETEGLRAIRKDGKYGFIDAMGRLRIANRYERARPFSDGLAAIRIRGKWGFIDRQERLIVQPVYDSVQDCRNGMAIVTSEGLSGVVDNSGKVLLPVRYHEIKANPHNRFLLRQERSFGLATATGEVIIQPRYERIEDPGNGYIIVERQGKMGVVTLRGVSTIPLIYDQITFDPYRKHFIALRRAKWETVRSW